MTDKLGNPPAFPHTDWIHPDTGQGQTYEGMTLRDYFAAKALTVIMSTYSESIRTDREVSAKFAYQFADAMLKARAE